MSSSNITYQYKRYQEGEQAYKNKHCTPSPNGKWGLHFGIHKGTLISRDSDSAQWKYGSFQECQDALSGLIKDFASIGYFIWFATALAPDGTRHTLVDGAPYN